MNETRLINYACEALEMSERVLDGLADILAAQGHEAWATRLRDIQFNVAEMRQRLAQDAGLVPEEDTQ